MRFTVIGHSGLFIESGGTTLLVDPWLSGSAYWRSWWHYPPTKAVDPAWLEPDAVYLTHHHFDHFHYPSLRRVSRDARVVVPRFAIDFMVEELGRLGFHDVTELDSGAKLRLGPSLEISSVQYGIDDSALLASDGQTVLADLNDCKVRGRAMRSISEAFGQPTFVFKNHSWAQAYPNCYTATDPADLTLIEPADYIEDFLSTVRELRPRYAVPFASMVCFLHPESRALNSHAITPPDVAAAFAADPVPGTDLVCMAPLDRWDSEDGFSLDPTDWYDDRDARVAELAAQAEPLVEQSLRQDAERQLTFDAFQEHFERFVEALPRAAGLTVKRPVVFHISEDELPAWVVDVRHRRVYRAAEPPADTASVVHMAPGLLADALASHIVDFVYISMRLRIDLEPGGVHSDLAFWGLLMIWDLGYLPLRHVLGRRSAAVAWRRRRELFDWATRLVGRGSLVGRMSGGLMADAET